MGFRLKRLETEEVKERPAMPYDGRFTLKRIETTPEEVRPSFDKGPEYKQKEIEEQIIKTGDIEQAVRASDGDLQWSLNLARGMAPEETNRLIRASKAAGMPVDVVKRNPKLAEDVVLSRDVIKKLTEKDKEGSYKYPNTLAYLSDPHKAAQYRDDYDSMAAIEEIKLKQKGWSGKTYHQLKEGAKDLVRGTIGAMEAQQDIINKSIEEDGVIVKGLLRSPVMRGFALLQLALGKENREGLAEGYESLRKENVLRPGADVEASGLKRYYYDFTRMLPQIAATVGSAGLGGVAAGSGFIGQYIFGQTYTDLKESGASTERAGQAAAFNATVQSALEIIPLTKLMKVFKSTGIKETLKNAYKTMLAEGGTEFLQSILAEHPSKIWGEAELKEQTASEQIDAFVNGLPKAMVQGAYEGLLVAPMGLVGAGGSFVNQLVKSGQHKKGLEYYDKLIDIAKKSKMLSRGKDGFEGFVEDISQKTETSNSFFLSLESTGALFQDDADGLMDFVERMGLSEQIEESKTTGQDIEINMGSFVAEYGDSDLVQRMRPEMRFEEGGMNEKEATKYQKEMSKEITQMASEQYGDLKEIQPLTSSLEKVKDQLINEVGMSEDDALSNIELVLEASNVFAQEYGISRNEYIENKLGLELQVRPEVEKGDLSQGKRGAIQFGDKNTISLFEKADMSTFLHESGHMFINEMQKLVDSNIASAAMKRDFETLKEYAGDYGSREGKEKLAKAFEQYLREGKAPSKRLRSAFRSFKKWLNRIYKYLRKLDVKLTDDVRGVFDRMLASEAQMQEVNEIYKSQRINQSFFANAPINKKQQKRLEEKKREADNEALEAHTTKEFNAYLRSIGGWKEQDARAEKEIEETPVYMAIDYIVVNGGLNDSILDYYLHPDNKKDLVKRFRGIRSKDLKYDLDIAEIAANHGYNSEMELMADIDKAPSKKEARTAKREEFRSQTEAQIREGLSLEESIPGEDAYHTQAQMDYLIEQATILSEVRAKETGISPKRYKQKVYKDAAREFLSKQKVRDAITYKKYAAAEARHSREAYEALESKDFDKAEASKESQLRAHAMVSVAIENKKKVEKIEKNLKKIAGKKLGMIQGDYHDTIKDILQKYEVITQGPRRPDKLNSEAVFAAVEDLEGPYPVILPSVVKDASGFTKYKDLKLDEFVALDAGISTIAAKGNETVDFGKYVGKEIEGVHYGTIVDAAVMPMEGRKTIKPPAKYKSTYSIRKNFNAIMAETAHIQFDLKAVDGFTNIGKKYNMGVNEKVLFRSLLDNHNKSLSSNMQFRELYLKPIEKVMQGLHKRLPRKTGIEIEGVPVPENYRDAHGQPGWTAEMILSLALNMGNVGNKSTLLAGYGLAEDQALKVMEQLTTVELEMVQNIWDALDTLFPEMDETFYKLNGYRLKKVENESLKATSNSGDSVALKGGYYPISHDIELSRRAATYSEKDLLLNEMNNVYGRAMPRDSQTKERKGSSHPISLNIMPLYRHIDNTIRYTNMAKVVHDVQKIIRSNKYANAYSDLMGSERYEILMPWLRNVARPEAKYMSEFDRIVQKSQKLTTIGALSISPLVASKQFLSLTSTVKRLGAVDTVKGVASFMQNPIMYSKFIEDSSVFMKERASKVETGMEETIKKYSKFKRGLTIGDKKITAEDLRDFAFTNIRIGDKMGAYPTWVAAYNKALDKGHDEAVKFADEVVAETQPVMSPLFRNLWQIGGKNATGAGRLIRWVTMPFTGWTAKFFARNRTYWNGWKEGKISTKAFAEHVIYERILPPIMVSLLTGMLREGEDIDDSARYIMNIIGYQFAGIPFLSTIVSVVQYGGFFGVMELPHAKPIKLSGKAVNATLDRDAKKMVKALAELAEFLYGIPVLKGYKELDRTIKAIGEGVE